MGNTTASNTINQTINQSLSIINTTAQSCPSTVSTSQLVDISNITGGSTVNIGTINLNDVETVDVMCVQDAVSSGAISSNVMSGLEQLAASTVAALNFNIGSVQADNTTNAIFNLGASVVQATTQTCTLFASSNQSFTINGVYEGSTVNVGVVNISNEENAQLSCVQNSQQVASATAMLMTAIDQSATATKSSIFDFLGGIIEIIVLVIAVIIILAIVLVLGRNKKGRAPPPSGPTVINAGAAAPGAAAAVQR